MRPATATKRAKDCAPPSSSLQASALPGAGQPFVSYTAIRVSSTLAPSVETARGPLAVAVHEYHRSRAIPLPPQSASLWPWVPVVASVVSKLNGPSPTSGSAAEHESWAGGASTSSANTPDQVTPSVYEPSWRK